MAQIGGPISSKGIGPGPMSFGPLLHIDNLQCLGLFWNLYLPISGSPTLPKSKTSGSISGSMHRARDFKIEPKNQENLALQIIQKDERSTIYHFYSRTIFLHFATIFTSQRASISSNFQLRHFKLIGFIIFMIPSLKIFFTNWSY